MEVVRKSQVKSSTLNGQARYSELAVGRREGAKAFPQFHSTAEMIRAIEEGIFPDRVMLTSHPQRWTDNPAAWAKPFDSAHGKELV